MTPSAESDVPSCLVGEGRPSHPGYCHLSGVRYVPRSCVGVCELRDETRVIPPGEGKP